MPKVVKGLIANIVKDNEKGSAWLVQVELSDGSFLYSAWKNASAAKRKVKEIVLAHTPKKSIKWNPGEALDEKGKPLSFKGLVTWSVKE